MGSYDSLLYRRGWLLTGLPRPQFSDPLSQQAFQRFRAVPFAEWTAYCDDCVPAARAASGENAALLLGLALNPFDGCNDGAAIVRQLLECREESERCFLEKLSELTGRFALAVYFGGTLELFTDACASRTVFYDVSGRSAAVSSHAALLADLLGYELSDDACYFFYHPLYKPAPLKRLPGLTAPFQQLRPLTPNTKLNPVTGQITRIFPLEGPPACPSYPALEEELAELMKRQAELLHRRTPILMSLSAGLDSRFTLAACRDIAGELDFFTHQTKNPVHREDTATAAAICSRFGLRHRVFQWDNQRFGGGFDDFQEIWLRNLGLPRGLAWLNKIYADEWPEGAVHLRSNIAEVAKADLSDRGRYPFSPQTLALLYTTTPMREDPRVLRAMEEFIDVTGFTPENLHSYDFYDLFEWEQIMCQWLGWLLLESDLSHDTFQLFNNRKILSKMLSIPYEDRLHRKLFLDVIRRLWPELLEFPVNGILYPA
ncbi:MAG: hypothetical protein LKJ80_00930 [Oscillibacter sp.]|jgi:hypothetical protein|nr:hypothetical protein [Oscillibacter sp.]